VEREITFSGNWRFSDGSVGRPAEAFFCRLGVDLTVLTGIARNPAAYAPGLDCAPC